MCAVRKGGNARFSMKKVYFNVRAALLTVSNPHLPIGKLIAQQRLSNVSADIIHYQSFLPFLIFGKLAVAG